MGDTFRALVISDLHAINNVSAARSGAAMNYGLTGTPRGLLTLCRDAVLAEYPSGIDVILVAGDITDRADAVPLSAVWEDLHWLASELHAPLVATSGNHDYDSRAQDDPLAYKSLLLLDPPFPFGTGNDRDKYFAEHHAVYVTDRAVVVSANSAAHHGYADEHGSPEHLHGRYSSVLPVLLDRSLQELGTLPPFKILLTHHHLNQLPGFDQEERSSSIGSEDLLRTLAEHGNWLVIHGHKHRGWIQYASGTGDAPPLLSSSSFSADFGEGGSFAEKVRHQFHVVELTDPTPLDGVTGARGRVTSWTHSDIGWRIASKHDDLPGNTGFGWKANLNQFATALREHVAASISISAQELFTWEPRSAFLTFDELRRLKTKLESEKPRVRLLLTETGSIDELSLVREDA